jgi:hypothetical protein
MSAIPFEGLITTILDKFFPNQTEIKKADIELKKAAIEAEITMFATTAGLLKGQMDTNTEEARNPNRTWMTWREMLGFVLVSAIAWQWVVVPFISFIALLVNHPVDTALLPKIEILDMVYLMCGMLGLDAAPILTNRFKSPAKR